MSKEEEIKSIEEEIKKTKYNKATQYHIDQLKAKLSRLKEDATSKKSTRGGFSYSVKKSGDATVILVGFPSVGKSTLLNSITSADSKIAAYEFTTLDVVPGVMLYNSAQIQVLDIPGLVSDAASGRGRGKEILSVVRNADLILIVADKPNQVERVRHELYDSGFRLNETPPNVIIKKMNRGGVKVSSAVKLKHIDKKMVQLIVNERGIHNAEILIRENLTLDRLIDATSKNRVYVKARVLYNKVDLLSEEERKKLPKDFIQISCLKKEGIENLKKIIWNNLCLMRIYLKKIGKMPDLEEPLIMKKGSNIYDVAEKIHKQFAYKLDYARIWGPSARFEGQKVGARKSLSDTDIVELHFISI